MIRCSAAAPHPVIQHEARRRAGLALLLVSLLAAPAAIAQSSSEPSSSSTTDSTTTTDDGKDDTTPSDSGTATMSSAKKPDAVPEALAGGSGVRVQQICTNCNQASLTVNGVTGTDHVVVTWDGVPAIGGLGTVYHTVQTPAELVGYSHVMRGPGSVLSGSGGMGGLLEFHSLARTKDQKAYLDIRDADYGSQSIKLAGADRWGPIGALVFIQGARGAKVDSSGDGYNELPKYERLTTHGIVDFHIGDHHTITASGLFYGENQWRGPGAPWEPATAYLDEDVFFNWRQYTLDWDGQFGDVQTSLKLSDSRRYQYQVAASTFGPTRPRIDYQHVTDFRHSGKFEAKVPVGKSGMITNGLGWSELEILFTNFESLEPLVRDGLDHWEAYSQYERSLGSKWNMSAGLRYDDMLVYGHATERFGPEHPDAHVASEWFLPRASVSYRPSSKLLVSLSTGRFAVGPTPIAERICCGAKLSRSIELKPEHSWSSQAQVELHPTPDMRFTVTLYRTDFVDYIQRNVKDSSIGVPRYELVNVPKARIEGIDLIHDMRFKGNVFNVGWTYTYSDSVDGDDHWLPFYSRATASAYFRYDQPKRGTNISFNLSYQGPLRHFALDPSRTPLDRVPVGWMKSSDYVTGNVSFDQKLGGKGWSLEGGVDNIADFTQDDLTTADRNGNGTPDEYERAYDWGPLQGRVMWAGVKFVR